MQIRKMWFELMTFAFFGLFLVGCNEKSDYQNSRKMLDEKENSYYEMDELLQYIIENEDPVIEVFNDCIYYSTNGQNLQLMNKEGENNQEVVVLPQNEGRIIDIYCVAEKDLFLMTESYEDAQKEYKLIELNEKGDCSNRVELDVTGAFYPTDFIIDDEKNIYIKSAENSIKKFDMTGKLENTLEFETTTFNMCKNNDSNIIVGKTTNDLFALCYLNNGTGNLEKQMQISICENGNGAGVFLGADNTCYFYDDNYLYGFVESEKLADPILSWMDIGIDVDEIKKVALFNDGSIFVAINNLENGVVSFGRLMPSDNSKIDREDIVLAGVNIDSNIKDKVILFNKENEKYRILVKDYMGEEDAYGALNLDIISGEHFDIMYLQGLPVDEFIKKGMLEDLSEYMNKEEFIDAYLQAVTQDGAIYQIAPAFSIYTMLGKAVEVGDEPGWTFAEYKECVEKYNDKEVVNLAGKQDLLRQICNNQISEFVNWENGTVNFEDEEFIQMLEFVNSYLREGNSEISYFDKLRNGEVLLAEVYLTSGNDYRTYKCVYNDEICAKGYPISNKQGNFMSLVLPMGINSKSQNKQVAWNFISSFMTDEAEYDFKAYGFPTRKDTLEKLFQEWKGNREEDSELTIY